jgi:hypothetical protein
VRQAKRRREKLSSDCRELFITLYNIFTEEIKNFYFSCIYLRLNQSSAAVIAKKEVLKDINYIM